jgi:iron complex transport system substrate-binding protein
VEKTFSRFVILPLLFLFLLQPVCPTQAAASAPTKTVTDRTGRTVRVPADPKHIACFFGPSYEKVFLLGYGDRVAAMSLKQSPWAHKFNPGLKKVAVMPSYSDPDVERIMSLGIDLVFYWQWPQQTRKMASAGIPVVCPFDPRRPESVEDFMGRFKEEILFYGQVLGPPAEKVARAYCSYFDRKLKPIVARTARIPESKRPSVYYISGKSIFGTQGGAGTGRWIIEMAGGNMVSKGLKQNFVDVSMEQVIAWNPEIVLAGGQFTPASVYGDPRWRTIRGVKNKRAYGCPEGVFLWGHGSSETPLFVMWLAKLLHPGLFRDIDLVKEIREYYTTFYHYQPTPEEARRIIDRLPPQR